MAVEIFLFDICFCLEVRFNVDLVWLRGVRLPGDDGRHRREGHQHD